MEFIEVLTLSEYRTLIRIDAISHIQEKEDAGARYACLVNWSVNGVGYSCTCRESAGSLKTRIETITKGNKP